eukprot:g31861.t1
MDEGDPVAALHNHLGFLFLGFGCSGLLLATGALCLMRRRLARHSNQLQASSPRNGPHNTHHRHARGHAHDRLSPISFVSVFISTDDKVQASELLQLCLTGAVLVLVAKTLHGSLRLVLLDKATPIEAYFERSLLSPELLVLAIGMTIGAFTAFGLSLYNTLLKLLRICCLELQRDPSFPLTRNAHSLPLQLLPAARYALASPWKGKLGKSLTSRAPTASGQRAEQTSRR